MTTNLNFVHHSSCLHAGHSNPSPSSTSLPASGSSITSPSDLTAPLIQGNTLSGSSALLISANLEISTPVLPGSTLDSTLPIAPATSVASPQIPQVDAIAQTLAPGTYDISVSPTIPAIATPLPALSPAVAKPSPVPSVVATPPTPTPAAAPIPDFVQRVLNLTNQFRAANGLAPLQLNIELDTAALRHSQDMALNDYFDHNGLNGSTPASRMNQVGYSSSVYGENIAAGYDTPEEVVQGWIDSPGHRANLLNPSFTEVGIGYYYLANDTGVNNYYSYWTQDFGGGDLNPVSYV